MNHPILHAWDCSCGTRNAANLPACHRCGSPASLGQPVYLQGPPVHRDQPKRSTWGFTPRGLVGWGTSAIVIFILSWLTNSITPLTCFLLFVGLIFFIAGHVIEASRR